MSTDRRKLGRKGPAVARHLPRDEEILLIAARVFADDGFENARMDEIARQAGVQKATLYHYFNSKEDLINRVLVWIERNVTPPDPPSDGTATERLESFVRRAAFNAAQYPITVFIKQYRVIEGPAGERARARAARNRSTLIGIITDGQRSGEFIDGPPETLFDIVLSVCKTLSEWYKPDQMSEEEAVGLATSFSVQGILRPRVQRRPKSHANSGRQLRDQPANSHP